jgi:hypothetical protein
MIVIKICRNDGSVVTRREMDRASAEVFRINFEANNPGSDLHVVFS